jgi:hypothetical protein
MDGTDGTDGEETHARITVLGAPPDLQLFAAAVVLVSPAGDLHGSAAGSCRCSDCW